MGGSGTIAGGEDDRRPVRGLLPLVGGVPRGARLAGLAASHAACAPLPGRGCGSKDGDGVRETPNLSLASPSPSLSCARLRPRPTSWIVGGSHSPPSEPHWSGAVMLGGELGMLGKLGTRVLCIGEPIQSHSAPQPPGRP
mmetsp:Transcript_30962/g.87205  ORF Transcript_30962/g.87205 Transcript_30962/m.87205 type:complete len:140 (-) Transcript_30962:30-449(-)